MGKKRINQLLDQLQVNHQADLRNSASIFTVAQVAVNELKHQDLQSDIAAIATLTPATIDKEELKQRYGSFNACRRAAKHKGIRFKRTPNWDQLIAAFAYFEACQNLIHSYVAANPNPNLPGISMEFKLD